MKKPNVRNILIFSMVVLFISPVYAEPQASYQDPGGLMESWINSSVDLTLYDSAMIHMIDFRNVKAIFRDNAEGDFKETIDTDTLEHMATIVYDQFSNALKDVIAIVEGEKIPEDKKILGIDIALSSTITASTLTLQCILFDVQSTKTIVVLSDTKKFASTDRENPFTSAEDLDVFSQIAASWGKRLKGFLSQKRQ
ncbi:hypothetical protein ACFL1E_06235 [Candidatus Omnitrophota bacterium]